MICVSKDVYNTSGCSATFERTPGHTHPYAGNLFALINLQFRGCFSVSPSALHILASMLCGPPLNSVSSLWFISGKYMCHGPRAVAITYIRRGSAHKSNVPESYTSVQGTEDRHGQTGPITSLIMGFLTQQDKIRNDNRPALDWSLADRSYIRTPRYQQSTLSRG